MNDLENKSQDTGLKRKETNQEVLDALRRILDLLRDRENDAAQDAENAILKRDTIISLRFAVEKEIHQINEEL